MQEKGVDFVWLLWLLRGWLALALCVMCIKIAIKEYDMTACHNYIE